MYATCLFTTIIYPGVKQVVEGEKPETYLIALFTDTLQNPPKPRIAGAIHVEWQLEEVPFSEADAESESNPPTKSQADSESPEAKSVEGATTESTGEAVTKKRMQFKGMFGSVSVYPWFERRGIGQALVKACEEYVKYKAQTIQLPQGTLERACSGQLVNPVTHAVMELPVIMDILVLNVRPELKGWYSKQGYTIYSEDAPFPYDHIVLPGWTIRGVMMKKELGSVSRDMAFDIDVLAGF